MVRPPSYLSIHENLRAKTSIQKLCTSSLVRLSYTLSRLTNVSISLFEVKYIYIYIYIYIILYRAGSSLSQIRRRAIIDTSLFARELISSYTLKIIFKFAKSTIMDLILVFKCQQIYIYIKEEFVLLITSK